MIVADMQSCEKSERLKIEFVQKEPEIAQQDAEYVASYRVV